MWEWAGRVNDALERVGLIVAIVVLGIMAVGYFFWLGYTFFKKMGED